MLPVFDEQQARHLGLSSLRVWARRAGATAGPKVIAWWAAWLVEFERVLYAYAGRVVAGAGAGAHRFRGQLERWFEYRKEALGCTS